MVFKQTAERKEINTVDINSEQNEKKKMIARLTVSFVVAKQKKLSTSLAGTRQES